MSQQSIGPTSLCRQEPCLMECTIRSLEGLQLTFKQFAALPYRMRDKDLEILLITTRKKRRWSVPKGWLIRRSTPQETAVIEAYEEAGVRGKVGKEQIGRFRK